MACAHLDVWATEIPGTEHEATRCLGCGALRESDGWGPPNPDTAEFLRGMLGYDPLLDCHGRIARPGHRMTSHPILSGCGPCAQCEAAKCVT